ncbi:enoyl-CoA hydratase-related protein [Ignavibacteria bacterium]|nr:enoyl-CoA hydratase/isomerase family protein [Bacteroidota bacterium]MCZ2133191.1 enoyl-CoA hydratase/isomerase family protein [Bacteroidota bacterium]
MEFILNEIEPPTARITLNRPDKRNALNGKVLRELQSAFENVRNNADIRTVILQGAGKAFCAGADLGYLQEISNYSVSENMDDSRLLQETFHTIYSFPKPVIAKIHGPAIAGGCGLATVCDFSVAARNGAKFGYSEVKIGFIPAVVSVYLLRKIGDTRTRRILLSAETFGADEAERIGLITHVVDDDKLDEAVNELAAAVTANSSSSLALTKELLNNLHDMPLDAGLRYAATMNAVTRLTDDCRNGIARFLK